MQTIDGTLIFSHGTRLPYGTEIPGKIRLLVAAKDSSTFYCSCIPPWGEHDEADTILDLSCKLGSNMYSKDSSIRPDGNRAECNRIMQDTGAYVAHGRALSTKAGVGYSSLF